MADENSTAKGLAELAEEIAEKVETGTAGASGESGALVLCIAASLLYGKPARIVFDSLIE